MNRAGADFGESMLIEPWMDETVPLQRLGTGETFARWTLSRATLIAPAHTIRSFRMFVMTTTGLPEFRRRTGHAPRWHTSPLPCILPRIRT